MLIKGVKLLINTLKIK
jgi:hypothetical protein